MKRRKALLPYQQGELDGLCGVYAVINGVRLALKDRADEFTPEDSQAFFQALMLATDEVLGAAQVAGCGVFARPLLEIAKIAARHLADEHDLKLTARLVFPGNRRLLLHELLPRMAALSQEPGSGVLMTLQGHLDHWSVLRRVGRTSLELFDSSGFVRVAVANCRASHEPQITGRREHVINPRAVICVSVRRA